MAPINLSLDRNIATGLPTLLQRWLNKGTAGIEPLAYQMAQVDRGNENRGIYLHSLRGTGEEPFRIVEKKTGKPLEIEMARFLYAQQKTDPALRRIFAVIYWMDEREDVLTYVMEHLPGTWDRRRHNMPEVFEQIIEMLVELASVGERHNLRDVLPDTIGAFDAVLMGLPDDPDFRGVHDMIEPYLALRQELTAHRVILSHNDVWGENVAIPLDKSSSGLIDIGRVSFNMIGADLIHFRRHYKARHWDRILHLYSEAFREDPQRLELGARTYAVQRSFEVQLRRQQEGQGVGTRKTADLLRELLSRA